MQKCAELTQCGVRSVNLSKSLWATTALLDFPHIVRQGLNFFRRNVNRLRRASRVQHIPAVFHNMLLPALFSTPGSHSIYGPYSSQHCHSGHTNKQLYCEVPSAKRSFWRALGSLIVFAKPRRPSRLMTHQVGSSCHFSSP